MAYEWDPRRARRARLIRLAAAVALSASAITVPVAVLLAAAPTTWTLKGDVDDAVR